MKLFRVQLEYIDNISNRSSEFLSIDLLLDDDNIPQSKFPTYGINGTLGKVENIFLLNKDGEMDFGDAWEDQERYQNINIFENGRKVEQNELFTITETGEEPYIYRVIKLHQLV